MGRPRQDRNSGRGPENSAHRGFCGASLKHRARDAGAKADLRFLRLPDGNLGRGRRSASVSRDIGARGSAGPPASRAPSDLFDSASAEGLGRKTRRENEVLRLLAHGLDQGTIAQELAISPATVGTHIQRILNKLDVHSRTQAVALAYREMLVDQM